MKWIHGMRILAAVLFVAAGANHFREPAFYARIVPPVLPWPMGLVVVSGIAEMMGGIGLMISRLRRWAGWGLIALLAAVFPANIYMAVAAEKFTDLHLPIWLLWVRLPLQIVFIYWVWFVALKAQWEPRAPKMVKV